MSLQSEDSFDQPLQEVAAEPELIFFQITKKTGKITDHFKHGLYKFDRRKFNSKTGTGFFDCSVPDYELGGLCSEAKDKPWKSKTKRR